jgi:hypothetical protein
MIWLMGVWQRSPAGRQIALNDSSIMAACRTVLPDLTDADIAGSPYGIKSYTIDTRLGELEPARTELRRRGLGLILDFVPNHVAVDHDWTLSHPEYFIQGTTENLITSPDAYFRAADQILAHGRDPYFPPWTDTAQLNAFSPALRRAASETLLQIAGQCDGVRCDMAMLLLTDVFTKTWGNASGSASRNEFWSDLIETVRRSWPDFLFIAEAYWDREWDLQRLGFDYCYDKRLYDKLVHDSAISVRAHLSADVPYQQKLIRFLENHDEPRAASVLPWARHRAAALAAFTLEGASLYFDGQFRGAKVHIPVQLGREPLEPCDTDLADFYGRIRALASEIKGDYARWQLCWAEGWTDNNSAENLLAWSWEGSTGRFLIAINFSHTSSQGRIQVPWRDLAGRTWRLSDVWADKIFVRDGSEMQNQGLYVALEPWTFHLLQFLPDTASDDTAVS